MLDTEVISYMKRFHHGESQAAHSRKLEKAFGIRSRELRDVVSRLRVKGITICSSDYGYFFAADEEELNRTIRQLTSRISKIAQARSGLIYARSLYSDDGQICLALEGGDNT